jgi:uncharacterized protein with GYD domain
MPLYMTQAAYTAEGWAALIKNPEDRSGAVRQLLDQVGGRLVAFYHTFGEYDVLVIYEAPDDTTATAVVLATASAGHLRATRTAPILTSDQAIEAMRRAGGLAFRPPGG